MSNLVSGAWWKAALIRAARTALVVAIPYLPASVTGQTPYLTILSAIVLAAILSLLTSLAGIAEADGAVVPWWYGVLDRVVKTVAQAIVTAVGNALLFQDVNWASIPPIVATAAFGSLLLAFLSTLPESEHPAVTSARRFGTVVNNHPHEPFAPVEEKASPRAAVPVAGSAQAAAAAKPTIKE